MQTQNATIAPARDLTYTLVDAADAPDTDPARDAVRNHSGPGFSHFAADSLDTAGVGAPWRRPVMPPLPSNPELPMAELVQRLNGTAIRDNQGRPWLITARENGAHGLGARWEPQFDITLPPEQIPGFPQMMLDLNEGQYVIVAEYPPLTGLGLDTLMFEELAKHLPVGAVINNGLITNRIWVELSWRWKSYPTERKHPAWQAFDAWRRSSDPLAATFRAALERFRQTAGREPERTTVQNFVYQFFTPQGRCRAHSGFRLTGSCETSMYFRKVADRALLEEGLGLRALLRDALASQTDKTRLPPFAQIFTGSELRDLGYSPTYVSDREAMQFVFNNI